MRRVVAVVAVVATLVATPVVGGALAQGAVGDAAGNEDSSVAEFGDTGSAVEESRNVDSAVETGGNADSQTIRKDVELSLTPDEPGAVDVEVTYDIPDPVTSLRVGVPADARDVDSDAFAESDSRYEWDGDTDPASLSFTMPANKTATGARASSIAQEGRYSFVDPGPWAIVTVPGLSTEWSWRSAERVTVSETVGVDGEGSTGGEIAYLGPVETYNRTANGQTFSLVVPEDADLSASPAEILDALAAAAGRFHVGERDERLWFVAAPTDADWGVRGVEYGGSDAWVLADSELEDPGNVWFHEYVHTRQAFRTASSGRWTTEAAAEYYSALLALRTGYVGFDAFERYLSYGERSPWRDAVLADPATWASGANYLKGSLVWGALDRRVRLATNSSYTMADVFYRLNQRDEPVTNGDVLAAVEDVSAEPVRDTADRYTETSDVPEMWTRTEHGDAFGTDPPRMEFEVREYWVEGPLRNESHSTPPTLYVGETLSVETVVTNDGGQVGDYEATLGLDGEALAAASGDLEPGDSDTVTLTHQLATPGTYTLSVGRNPVDVTVREPAAVEVSDLSVSETSVSPDDDVTATVRLTNPSDDYATGPVEVTLDGETVTSLDASLTPGRSTTRTVTVSVSSAGEHVLAAGDESVTLTVASENGDGTGAGQGDGTDRDDGTGTRIPGFSVGIALLAAALAVGLASRRR